MGELYVRKMSAWSFHPSGNSHFDKISCYSIFCLLDLFYPGLIFTDKENRQCQHNYREIFL